MDEKKLNCSTCLIIQDYSEFYSDRTKENGKRTTCKKCCHKRQIEYYKKNSPAVLRQCKEYRDNDKEHYRKIRAKYHASNPEPNRKRAYLYRINNLELVKQRQKLYRENNIKKIKVKKAFERAERRKRCPRWAKSLYLNEFSKIYNNVPDNQVVDHIIPLQGKNVSGLHVPWNLQYLTISENSRKQNKFDNTYNNESWRLFPDYFILL